MSYAAIITTQKEANNYINEQVYLENALLLKNPILQITEREKMYLIVRHNEFSPPYYPAKKGKAWNDKETFVETLRYVNEQYLIKKLLFVFLGEDETIHKIEICDLQELIALIKKDTIKANVLYKVKHSYIEYNK